MKLATEEIVPVFEIGIHYAWIEFVLKKKVLCQTGRGLRYYHYEVRDKEFGI